MGRLERERRAGHRPARVGHPQHVQGRLRLEDLPEQRIALAGGRSPDLGDLRERGEGGLGTRQELLVLDGDDLGHPDELLVGLGEHALPFGPALLNQDQATEEEPRERQGEDARGEPPSPQVPPGESDRHALSVNHPA